MKLYRWLALLPLGWLLLFAWLPYVVLLKVSLAQPDDLAQPPYTPFFSERFFSGPFFSGQGVLATFDNFRLLAGDSLYVAAYLGSLRIAALSTFVALVIGYPMAYAIARAPDRWRLALLMGIVLPFWTSFLIRVYAWMGLLNQSGPLNGVLQALGLIDSPLELLHTDLAVVVGIAYAYLPFMILPIYAVLARLDVALLEAAADLGARPWRRFWTVTVPLSWPGVAAGALLVFIPAVGEFVIPDLLGGTQTLMIGKVLWNEFFINGDWTMASAVAVVMMIVLVLPLVLFDRAASKAA